MSSDPAGQAQGHPAVLPSTKTANPLFTAKDQNRRASEFVPRDTIGCTTRAAGVCQTAAVTSPLITTPQPAPEPAILHIVLITLPRELLRPLMAILEITTTLPLLLILTARPAIMALLLLITPPTRLPALCLVQDLNLSLPANVHQGITG